MSTFHNRTRTSPSIPAKLVRQGKLHLVPIYYGLLTSRLAREGIYNSGSYQFADHIYAGRPSGRYGIGYVLDYLLLSLPSAQSFRFRYLSAKQEIMRLIASRLESDNPVHILSVPCGYAREIFETIEEQRELLLAKVPVVWCGLDLDAHLIAGLQAKSRAYLHSNLHFTVGDALLEHSYNGAYDMIISLGFGEFLKDDQVIDFYSLAKSRLRNKGTLVTSGMTAHRLSDYLLRTFGEIHTHYRTESQLKMLASRAGFTDIHTYQDSNKLQTMVICQL